MTFQGVDRATMSDPMLQLVGVHKAYGRHHVLNGVDLSLVPDELVALVGENGSGKTTIVRCLTGQTHIDRGQVLLDGRPVRAGRSIARTVEVVWQDLALADNLDVTANMYLGKETTWTLPPDARRQVRVQALLRRLGTHIPDVTLPVSTLSGGQRQAVALARTLVGRPRILVLDEPTSALDKGGVDAVLRLIQAMRARSVGILLISHDMDLVSQVADRALVLRDGHITADVRRPGLSGDRLRALISGLEVDVQAKEHLQGLRSLVDQLSEVKPAAVLPLIVSATSVALDQDEVALHLVDRSGSQVRLDLAAGLGLDPGLRSLLSSLPARSTDPHWDAIDGPRSVVVADVRTSSNGLGTALLDHGIRSMWSVPLLAAEGAVGTLSGYSRVHGETGTAAVRVAELYAAQAAATLDRERLLTTVTRRNRTLETLRQMLEALTGPGGADTGLQVALEALRRGLDASHLALLRLDDHQLVAACTAAVGTEHGWDPGTPLPSSDSPDLVRSGAAAVRTQTVDEDGTSRALVAMWGPGEHPRPSAEELLVDGTNSVVLALRRRAQEEARRETLALRRSNSLQRTFLSRLSHELRTPLTAIHGYADSLRLTDVEWESTTRSRFLETIARESDRLGNLVVDLLDASAIDAGVLRLQVDWCDLALVVDSALGAMAASGVTTDIAHDLPPVRADHDRLEQVLVNLVTNAVTHTPDGTAISVRGCLDDAEHVRLTVADDGPGLSPQVVDAAFQPGVRNPDAGGTGLGLSIAHGIVTAHGGTITIDTSPLGTSFVVLLPLSGPSDDRPVWSLSDPEEELA